MHWSLRKVRTGRAADRPSSPVQPCNKYYFGTQANPDPSQLRPKPAQTQVSSDSSRLSPGQQLTQASLDPGLRRSRPAQTQTGSDPDQLRP